MQSSIASGPGPLRGAIPPALASALIPLAAFGWFWFWRSNAFSGGDSEQWERYIDGGVWLQNRQSLSFACMQLAFKVSNALFDWPARWAINLTSCAAGAGAALIVWKLAEGWPHRVWAFALLATAGFTTVFYGHIETYAMPACALLGHLLAARLALEGRAPRWVVPATYFLAAGFHLVMLFAAPALLWTMFELHRARPMGRGELARQAALVAACALAIPLLISLAPRFGSGSALIIPANWENAPMDLAARPWRVFGGADWGLRAWFMLVNAGAMGPLAFWAAYAVRRDGWARCAAAYFACFLVFTALWVPHAGRADFDLFSFPWIAAAALFARGAFDLPGRAAWVGLALGANLWTFLARPVIFADLPARGSGRIEFRAAPDSYASGLIDERLLLRPRNRLPAGGHEIAIRFEGRAPIRRVVNLRPGERFSAVFENGALLIEAAGEEQRAPSGR